MLQEHVRADIEEIDTSREDAPAWAKGWSSPTILIGGRDIAGGQPMDDGAGCRLYKEGAPTVDEIRRSIRDARAKPEDEGASCANAYDYAGTYCDDSKVCRPTKGEGARCESTEECPHGDYANHVCTS